VSEAEAFNYDIYDNESNGEYSGQHKNRGDGGAVHRFECFQLIRVESEMGSEDDNGSTKYNSDCNLDLILGAQASSEARQLT
jgi:hypothetical protein